MSDIDTIYFAKLKPDATIPSKRNEDGAYDVYACFPEEEIILYPHDIAVVPTGLASAFSPKYRMVFQERGSSGLIGLKINAGLIDSGFRGEWFVVLNNTSGKNIYISKRYDKVEHTYTCVYYPYTKAIAQVKVQEVPQIGIREITPAQLLKFDSERGTGALGSSGK